MTMTKSFSSLWFMAANNMITLTSDFGLKDPYVAEMKGVILTIDPKATLIDITHKVEKFNVRQASFALASAVPFFPDGTIHLAVVDPGVGTERRALVVKTKKSIFVGPDNGVLVLAAQSQGIQNVYWLANQKFMLANASSTFHGRDIFAPATAHLDLGVKPDEFGPEVHDLVTPKFAQVKKSSGSLLGEVLDIDSFGNIITNVPGKYAHGHRDSVAEVTLANTSLQAKLGTTYAQAKPGEPLLLVGSHGYLEVALNRISAAEKFKVKAADKIEIKF